VGCAEYILSGTKYGGIRGITFLFRGRFSETFSLVPYRGFCSAGCVEWVLLWTKCCVVRGNWRDRFFGSGLGFQKISLSSLTRGFALWGALNIFCRGPNTGEFEG
jgi:hypothetical protein